MLRSGRAFLGLVWAKHLTKEGPMPFISSSRVNAASFSLFKRSMMQESSLPLADVLDDQRWQQVFDEHEIDFGNDPDAIYTPAISAAVKQPSSVLPAYGRHWAGESAARILVLTVGRDSNCPLPPSVRSSGNLPLMPKRPVTRTVSCPENSRRRASVLPASPM